MPFRAVVPEASGRDVHALPAFEEGTPGRAPHSSLVARHAGFRVLSQGVGWRRITAAPATSCRVWLCSPGAPTWVPRVPGAWASVRK